MLAIVTMVIGNLGALAQTNLKRMLAYSSVAHAGYLLTALVAAPGAGRRRPSSSTWSAYAAVNLGGFGALAALARDGREPLSLADVAGLAERRPVAGGGAHRVPDLADRRAGLRRASWASSTCSAPRWTPATSRLAIVGVLMSVVSAYYYLRVVVAMYMGEPVGEDRWRPSRRRPAAVLALALSAGVTLLFGLWPRAACSTLARLAEPRRCLRPSAAVVEQRAPSTSGSTATPWT